MLPCKSPVLGPRPILSGGAWGTLWDPPMPNQIKVYKGGTLSSSLDVVSLPTSICDRNIYREDEHGNEKNNLLKSSAVMKTPCSLIQILRNQEHDSASLIRSSTTSSLSSKVFSGSTANDSISH
jgi:hypothetical protein